jgi:hypothetical protein
LKIIVRAILAGESISVVSQERNLSGKSLQPQDKIRAESLREIIAMTEEEGVNIPKNTTLIDLNSPKE